MTKKRLPRLDVVGVMTLIGVSVGVWATFRDAAVGFRGGSLALAFILNVGVGAGVYFFIGRVLRRGQKALARKRERRKARQNPNKQTTRTTSLDSRTSQHSNPKRSLERHQEVSAALEDPEITELRKKLALAETAAAEKATANNLHKRRVEVTERIQNLEQELRDAEAKLTEPKNQGP